MNYTFISFCCFISSVHKFSVVRTVESGLHRTACFTDTYQREVLIYAQIKEMGGLVRY
jgi:hypothetical protein